METILLVLILVCQVVAMLYQRTLQDEMQDTLEDLRLDVAETNAFLVELVLESMDEDETRITFGDVDGTYDWTADVLNGAEHG